MRRQVVLLLALVIASALACKDGRRFTTEPDGPAPQVFTLTASGPPSLPADGLSTLELVVQVPASSVSATRFVRFRTTAGTFDGAASTATQQADAAFSPDGSARALLRSSTTPGRVLVTAQVMDGQTALSAARELALEFVLPADGQLRFVEAAASAPADGATVSIFAVEVPPQQPLSQRTVVFTTSLGSFDGASLRTASVNAGADGRASVPLYSPLAEGLALVTASVGTHAVDTRIQFRAAVAETILVEAPGRIVQGQAHAIKVTLVRHIGTPTAGTVITLSAFDSSGARFGDFRNVTLSNASGVATAEFLPGATARLGVCRIEARAAGSPALGTAACTVVAPPPPGT